MHIVKNYSIIIKIYKANKIWEGFKINYEFFSKKRILFSRVIALIFIIVLLGRKPDVTNEILFVIFSMIGLILTGVGALGRVWASMYIYGYKTKKLINEGPYSVVRNPLYCVSFIGAVGLAIASMNLLFLILLIVAYLTYYPLVVRSEEEGLKKALGEDYLNYIKTVPRFIPKFSLFKLPEVYDVNAKKYVRAFVDAIWFFVAYGVITVLAIMHLKNIIPVF